MSTTIQINIPQDRTPSNNNIIRGEPPAYSEDNNNNNATTSVNISSPTTAYLSPNSSSISTNPSSESLPSYDNANNDVPPLYPTDSLKLNSIVDPYYDLVPIEPQNPWPISKKFYIFGFLIWPLWYIGIPFGFFGKDQETKRWGRRCIFNAIILSAVFGYLIVAYYKSISHS